MSKKWLFPAVLAVGVFVALAGYGDFGGTVEELGNLPVRYLFAALSLASANFLLRFLRWAFYLRVLKITAPAGVSALVFLSGLAMSITPGKAGELVKCYLLNSRVRHCAEPGAAHLRRGDFGGRGHSPSRRPGRHRGKYVGSFATNGRD